jgi:hypothetical protein
MATKQTTKEGIRNPKKISDYAKGDANNLFQLNDNPPYIGSGEIVGPKNMAK